MTNDEHCPNAPEGCEHIPVGTRIRFPSAITEAATGDHPEFFMAQAGQTGEVIGWCPQSPYPYSVKPDGEWPEFAAKADDFEVIDNLQEGQGMTNDKKQPRYVAEHAGLGDWTVTDKQLLITVAYQCRQSMASHIADCLNACDGAEGLTPGCVAKMGAFKDELCYLVDRLGHDSGGFCSWGQESPTAKEWANEVYRIALDNEAYIIAAKDAEIARLRAGLEDVRGSEDIHWIAAVAEKALTNESEATDDQQ